MTFSRSSTGRSTSRRQFLLRALAAGALPGRLLGMQTPAAASNPAEALPDGTIPREALAHDPRRPQFHLLPARNWMNDPNGPVYFRGRYHMFFQYNPQAAVWGNMSWNHAVSPDMLHWTHLPLALAPAPGGPDSFGVFSGTSLVQGDRVYAVYTGVRKCTPEEATLKDGGPPLQEAQCLAWSDDHDLVHWSKAPMPVIPLPPPGVRITGFRDPSPWKQDEGYYMVVGAGEARAGGCVLLYRSNDLRHWEYLHKLAEGRWNGRPTPNPCDDGEMWECPDFFALDGGHVLIYSTLNQVFWQSGVLDPASMKFAVRKTGLLDLDAFYAPKTQLDQHGRRILWGWVPERRSEDEMRKAGWSGMMALPRVLKLDADGTLRMEVLPETRSLRTHPLAPRVDASATTLSLPAANGEILLDATRASSFELTLSVRGDELMRIAYSAGRHLFTANGKDVALQAADLPHVRAFVDGSVLEVLLAGRVGYTKRFYYSGDVAPAIELRMTGHAEKLEAWAIRPVSPNRLTTPA